MNRKVTRMSALLGCACVAVAAAGALAQHEHPTAKEPAKKQTQQTKEAASDPYPLETCPVTGKKLGSMGDPVVKTYDGREVRFCCGGCIKKFEGDKAGYWKKVDEEIVKAQTPFYPMTTCVISGEELGTMGEPIDYVYNNRLVRFCCEGCMPKFNKDPQAAIAKLDEAVIKQQAEHYPMTTCVISGEELGSMGAPVDLVYNNHLVRLCCKGCIKKFEKEPATHLGTIDEAWKAQGGAPGAKADGADEKEKPERDRK